MHRIAPPRRLSVSGVELDVLEHGTGRPLLLLHAAEGPATYGTDHIEALARHFRVIAPWHPGFGNSQRPQDFRGVDDLAYLYLDLCDHLGLDDAVLVGASFGGWIAAEMAVRSTQHFGHLVLAAPLGIKLGDREQRDILDLHAIGVADWPSRYFAAPERMVPDFSQFSPEDLLGIARGREAVTLYGWRPYMHNPRLRRWLHRIDIPALLVWGAQDGVVDPAYGRGFASLIPGSDFCVIDGAGHLVHVEAPDAFADLVTRHAAVQPVQGHLS